MSRTTCYCSNCGKYGHLYKNCNEPITSYGIILYKIHNNNIKYLLIRRKDSLSYVEFIRGRYNVNNIDYITHLINNMTIFEKNNLIKHTYEELWDMLWIKPSSKQYRKEFNISINKFNILKHKENDSDKSLLETIVSNSIDTWTQPEWGFPKGRRNIYENDIDCAQREFTEETGITNKEYIVFKHINPIYEVFTGSNNVRYKHVYYIGLSLTDNDISINKNNKTQITEVGDIGWYNYIDSINLIRQTNKEKKVVLSKVNNLINKLCIKRF